MPTARFRAKDGFPLDAGVLPKAPPPTASAAVPLSSEESEPAPQPLGPHAQHAPPAGATEQPPAAAPANAHQPAPAAQQWPPEPPYPPSPQATYGALPPVFAAQGGGPYQYHDYPDPGPVERDNSAVHTALVGIIVTASIAAGLWTSFWLNDKDKRAQAQLREPVAAAQAPLARTNEETAIADFLPQPSTIPPGEAARGALVRGEPDETRTENPPPLATAATGVPAPAARPAPPVDDEIAPPVKADKPVKTEQPDGLSPAPAVAKAASNEKAATPDKRPAAVTHARAEQEAARKKKSRSHAAAAPRKAPVTVARKDRTTEIDRVRAQAYSESSKDRINNARPARANPAPAQPGKAEVGSLSRQLAQCQRIGSFFGREQCKWRLCDGKWGQNGCPSYETKSAAY